MLRHGAQYQDSVKKFLESRLKFRLRSGALTRDQGIDMTGTWAEIEGCERVSVPEVLIQCKRTFLVKNPEDHQTIVDQYSKAEPIDGYEISNRSIGVSVMRELQSTVVHFSPSSSINGESAMQPLVGILVSSNPISMESRKYLLSSKIPLSFMHLTPLTEHQMILKSWIHNAPFNRLTRHFLHILYDRRTGLPRVKLGSDLLLH